MATTFEVYSCPADTSHHDPDRGHGFPDDSGVCVCGETWVSERVEYPDDHPLVVAFSSPTVRRPRRQRRT